MDSVASGWFVEVRGRVLAGFLNLCQAFSVLDLSPRDIREGFKGTQVM